MSSDDEGDLPPDIKARVLLNRDYVPIDSSRVETKPDLPEELADKLRGVPDDFEYKGKVWKLDRNTIKPNGVPQLKYRLLRYVPIEGLEEFDF